jgi:hypothetical protein
MLRLIRNRRGLVLPFTLFLVTMITLILAMAFSRSAVEIQISRSSDASITAFAVAQGGLAAFLGDSFTLRPQPGDSFRYNVVGGYAWIVPEELQKPADTVMNEIVYAIRSSATVIEPASGAQPQAVRTIIQMARWYTPVSLPGVPALITAGNGIVRPAGGGQLTLMAQDQCGSGAADLAQMMTTPALPAMDANSGTGPILNTSALVIDTASQVDWALVMGGSFSADYNTILLNDTTYSTQMVVGDATISMPDNGTGILIVTGNLFITGTGAAGDDVDWNGVIMVGGYVSSTADFFDMNGIMVTGLNESLPPYVSVAPNSLGGGGSDADFLYNPCEVRKATARMNGFRPIPGTLVDNWATY